MFGFLKKTLKKIIKEDKPEEEKKLEKTEKVEGKRDIPKKESKKEIKVETQEIKEEKPKRRLFSRKISEKDLEKFKFELFRANISLEAADRIVENIRNSEKGKVKGLLKETLYDLLKQKEFDFVKFVKDKIKEKGYCVVVFFGFNGSGKTTTIARIGYLLKKNKIPVVFAAADTFRAAAIEQLSKHGENLEIRVIKHRYGSDPAAVVFDAKMHVESVGGVVLVDTAGRTHADKNLMEELKKIIRVNEPDYKILVLDSLTGNDILDQVENFSEIRFDGIILTKLDVNEKGGSIISVKQKTDKPILYLGIGQDYKDLEEFDSKKIIDKLLD
jgi:fused signal recognition particle receptor